MMNQFISKERKLSGIKGTGIQYIPGHIEPLVDLIINEYLDNVDGNILDLGGGGLRFAIPVAALNKKITVVDFDVSSVNLDLIYSRMKKNGLTDYPDLIILQKNILPIIDNVFHFLETTEVSYSLITAFRLIHFFNKKEINTFFRLISKCLKREGKLVISAFVQYDGNSSDYNEIFINSEPVEGNLFYRKFYKNEIAEKIQKDQNLGSSVHLFSEEYLKEYSNKYKFKLIADNLPSTRIVRGFVFKK